MGYGLIKVVAGKPVMMDMGVLTFKKEKDHFSKLNRIFDFVTELVNKFGVDELAIEAPFYGENVQSMLKLGRAQGVAIAAGLHCGIPITEYAPRSVKMAVTGRGSASKEQVAGLLQHLLGFKGLPDKLDATDGLAIALCHFYQSKKISSVSSFKNWKDFLAKNPERVKS
jgi:crossover junction endodeoxyribonuclease RuvC